MNKIIAICLIISLAFVLVACSESEEYEVVGTLPEIVQGTTDVETGEAPETTNSSELIEPNESVGTDEATGSANE